MKIDNFEQVDKFLNYPDKDTYYFLQILKRRKENPGLNRDVKLIKNFYLKEGELNKFKDYIIELCVLNNARAYIRLNKRSFERTAIEAIKKIAELISSRDFEAAKRAYDHVAGKYCHTDKKLWLVDVDSKEALVVNTIMHNIRLCSETNCTVAKIETINGYHIITTPFNRQKFSEINKTEISIQRDNPTLLYYEKEN
jgi:hypothetical protein